MKGMEDIEVSDQKMVDPEELKKVFIESGNNTPQDKVIGDLLGKSISMFFELGFELAKNLNLEMIFDEFKKEQNKK